MTEADMAWLPLERGAIGGVLGRWCAGSPAMGVLALLPETEKVRLPLLQEVCREQGVPLVGAIFPALVTAAGFRGEGAWLLRLAQMPPAFLLEHVNAGQGGTAQEIAREAEKALACAPASGGKPTLYLVFDGLVPNIASILDDLYLHLADRVCYAGANAGSESFRPMPCLFDSDRVVGDGVLCLLLPGGSTTVLAHGFVTPERTMIATSTEGNRILSIDWRPAFDAYQEIIKAEYGIALTRKNFYQYGVHFPFGIPRADGEVLVRIPVGVAEDGSLHCVGEVPENTMLMLLKAPGAEGGGARVGELARGLAAANGPLTGRELLVFYCAGRRQHLGDGADRELAELRSRTGVTAMAGALSLGEIGSTRAGAYPLFHNATLVCTPWQQGR